MITVNKDGTIHEFRKDGHRLIRSAVHIGGATEAILKWHAEQPIYPVSFENAILDNLDLSDLDLTGVHFDEASMVGTNLKNSALRGAFLRKANLTNACLDKADLSGAIADGCVLTNASCRNTDFSGASLVGTDMHGADLSGASFNGTRMRGASYDGYLQTKQYVDNKHNADSIPLNFNNLALFALGKYAKVHKKDAMLLFRFNDSICATFDGKSSNVMSHINMPKECIDMPVDELGISDKSDFIKTVTNMSLSGPIAMHLCRENVKGFTTEYISIKARMCKTTIKTHDLTRFNRTDANMEYDLKVPSPRGTFPASVTISIRKDILKELCSMMSSVGNPSDFILRVDDTLVKIYFANEGKTESIVLPPELIRMGDVAKFKEFARDGVRHYASEVFTAMKDIDIDFEMEINCGNEYGQSVVKCYGSIAEQGTLATPQNANIVLTSAEIYNKSILANTLVDIPITPDMLPPLPSPEEVEKIRQRLLTNSFTDPRDGRTYKTVKIGKQVWMAENLAFDYKGSFCYDNKLENADKYGLLYNWETAMKVAPPGWHLPSNEEWTELADYLGGNDKAGKKLKAVNAWNNDSTNEVGFTALPGGRRYTDGSFYDVGGYGFWWSSSPDGSSYAWRRRLSTGGSALDRFSGSRQSGFSVRLVRD